MAESSAISEGAIQGRPLVGCVSEATRLNAMMASHFGFIWRSLRRLGVLHADADDAAQQVFVIAARKLGLIDPACERSFLFRTAVRVASEFRRTRRRRREALGADVAQQIDQAPDPETMFENHRARGLLDSVLDAMPHDLRIVFVLFELEEMSVADIAALLEVPNGTVSSRLRRAREEFHECARRARARSSHPRGM